MKREEARLVCWLCAAGGGRRSGHATARFHWVYPDGTCAAVCNRHASLARERGAGYGWPLASIPGLEVAVETDDRTAFEMSRPRTILAMIRDELRTMVAKEVGRLQVHVHWSDE